MSMYMGFYYNEPNRGKGYILEARGDRGRTLVFPAMTKASALTVKAELFRRGYSEEDIDIRKN